MGMIHAYKILDKAMAEDKEANMNDVDYIYLTEMQRRNIHNPLELSAEFPYVFSEINTSTHDNVHLGMMNVFTLLDQQKQNGEDLNTLDCNYLINSLTRELQNADLYLHYDKIFVPISSECEDLK